MEDLSKSLSLNTLYRYFLPGAILSYYIGWRLNHVPRETMEWTLFTFISFAVGTFVYLLYRGLLHPLWCLFQNHFRSIPAFDLYCELIESHNLYDNSNESKYVKLIQSQICLGAFLSCKKYQDWQTKNEFRISSIHFLYLVTNISILLLFFEGIFFILFCGCDFYYKPDPITFSIILFLGAFALFIGEYYDRIADANTNAIKIVTL